MRPNLDFTVLFWVDDVHVAEIRLFGTDHQGRPVDKTVEFPGQGLSINSVAMVVAKMNNGRYREAES